MTDRAGGRYTCTKNYGHDLGLSCCFRQWRANSHCRYLHGYALAFRFEFACDELDENGWVVDFGSLKPLKERLQATFDHRLAVAIDDPAMHPDYISTMAELAQVVVLERVGCEAFAKLAFEYAEQVLVDDPRVRVTSCTCSEHGANSATYRESTC